jgi:hypothetical protein
MSAARYESASMENRSTNKKAPPGKAGPKLGGELDQLAIP